MFNLDQFRAFVYERGGYQPQNRVEVLFNAPNIMRKLDTFDGVSSRKYASEMRFWIAQVPTPGVTLKLHPVLRYGYGIVERKPVAPEFTGMSLLINSDAEGENWNFFKKWISLISPFNLSKGMTSSSDVYDVPYKADYVVDMIVTTYTLDNQEVHKIIYRDVFPVSLPPIEHAWANKDKIVQFPVGFSFIDWYTDAEAFDTIKTPSKGLK